MLQIGAFFDCAGAGFAFDSKVMNALQQHDLERLALSPWLVGIDEAGRGCLAGSVVAGACVLSRALFASVEALERSARINDSKQLDAGQREAQYTVLGELQAQGWIDFAVASSSVDEIARHNILGATRLAMQRAVEALAMRATGWTLSPYHADDPLFAGCGGTDSPGNRPRLLIDGRPLKPFPYSHEGLIKGDGRSLVIAMASIAAKVTRDREMVKLARTYPEYGFERHKGYGTLAHVAALKAQGPSPAHRALFLRKVL